MSDNLPMIGENKNWTRENTEMITPTKKISPPTRSTNMGKIGIIIPKPRRSMKTTSKSVSVRLSIRVHCTIV